MDEFKLWSEVALADKLLVIGYFIYSGSAAAKFFHGSKSANIFEAIRYCHLNDIIHRDITPMCVLPKQDLRRRYSHGLLPNKPTGQFVG